MESQNAGCSRESHSITSPPSGFPEHAQIDELMTMRAAFEQAQDGERSTKTNRPQSSIESTVDGSRDGSKPTSSTVVSWERAGSLRSHHSRSFDEN